MSNIDHEALSWTARQAARPLSDSEQAAFEAWIATSARHQGAYLRARAIEHTLAQAILPHSLRPATLAAESGELLAGELPLPAHELPVAEAAAPAAAAASATRAASTTRAAAGATVPADQVASASGNAAAAPGASVAGDRAPALSRRKRGWALAGMAAAVTLVVAVAVGAGGQPWLAWQPGHKQQAAFTVLQTATGELRTVPLADQSLASINSASVLEVAMDRDARRVRLQQGEAWFQVAKDAARPFVVSAGDARIRAVGTAFSVRRQPHGADVVVTEGVVDVWRSGPGGAPRLVRVAAGQQTFVPERDGAIAVRRQPAAAERQLAWRDGMIVLQNEPLSSAVAEFNRYSARQIVIVDPALRSRTFVGSYRTDEGTAFANDVRALLKVPVAFSANQIRIGTAPANN